MTATVLCEGSNKAVLALSRPGECRVSELNPSEKAEVLSFLAARPLRTVVMAGMIEDNGLSSPHNRGSFYVSRNREGLLQGVALIGQLTLMEVRDEESLSSFARLMQQCPDARVVRGERETIESFFKQYPASQRKPKRICNELLLVQSIMPAPANEACDLRPATSDDLAEVLKINDTMAFQESGASPLDRDPAGFRERTIRRIEQKRIWIWKPADKLIFKADIIAETPQAAYLEGVYVNSEERMKGYGRRCMSELARTLLQRTRSICLTVNERNQRALSFYLNAGYHHYSHYHSIYLRA